MVMQLQSCIGAYPVRDAQAPNHCLWTGLYPDELLSCCASSLCAQQAMSLATHRSHACYLWTLDHGTQQA